MNNTNSKDTNLKLQKKTSAKIAGVKSVMKTSDGTTVIATFGKGNDAVLEKRIVNDEIKDINKLSKISVDAKTEKKRYIVVSKSRKSDIDDPSHTGYTDKLNENTGMDLLGLKNELEQEIFGDNFNDNIRVQIAYNIFDIVKALAPAVNNIVYTLNSLDRKNGHKNDVIGFTLNYKIPFNNFGKNGNENKKDEFDKYYKNAEKNFKYYYDIFCHTEKDKNNKMDQVANSNKDIYYALQLVNLARNNVSHFGKNDFIIFNKEYNMILPQLKAQLVDSFNKKVDTVNRNFIANEKNNLWLIAKALDVHNEAEYKKLACELYELSVIKSNKNLGFNLIKLRESAIEQKIIWFPFEEQVLNTFKSKLYKILDFVVIHYLKNKGSWFVDEFVDALRKASDDEAKEQLYKEFSAKLYKEWELKKQLISVINSFKHADYRKKENVIKIKSEWIDRVKISENAHDFSKLIYFISRFLDGKEINILLTTLISKFQVIDAFNKTVSELNDLQEIKSSTYTGKYALFADSGKVAEELNFIKSITKMTTKYENLSLESMFKEALLTLGVTEDNVEDVYKQYFNKKSKTRLSAFFKNNILESGRFKYVVKYLNPTQVPKVAKNKAVVRFVLNRMPDTQIDRYYLSVVNPQGNNIDKNIGKNIKINEIADLILNTDFNSFTQSELSNIDKNGTTRKGYTLVREQKKALLSLYYTVVYIFVKNLVQINSCYFIGYFYLERDNYFFGKKYSSRFGEEYFNFKDKDKDKKKGTYNFLTRIFTGAIKANVKQLKSKDVKKLKRYIDNFVDDINVRSEYEAMYRQNRNNVEHLSVISLLGEYVDKITVIEDYFDAYHYILQRVVYQKLSKKKPINKWIGNDELATNFDDGKNVIPYSKPLLRAINIPFGYTLTRYKNLSYKKLFLRGREGV